MTNNEFIDWALDNQGLSQSEFTRELKGLLETVTLPYNHESENTIEACGITHPGLIEGEVKVKASSKKSLVCEELEKEYTKRDLAFILVHTREQMEDLKHKTMEMMMQMMLGQK